MTVSDKSGKDKTFVVRPNNILFSCKLDKVNIANSKIVAISDKKKKLLTLPIDDKISADVATAYNLVYAIHGKNINLPGDFYQSTETLKKRIVFNAFFAIAAQQINQTHGISRKCSPDRTFSIEEYILIELINKYKIAFIDHNAEMEPIQHNSTFLELLEWVAASNEKLETNDIFSLYYKDVFSDIKSEVLHNEIINDFFSAKSFKINNENSFLYSDTVNSVPIYKILPLFCNILSCDWQTFFQALQKLSNFGLVSIKSMVIKKEPGLKLMPTNIINPFLDFKASFDYHTAVKLLSNITRQKLIKCSLCDGQLMFANKVQICSKCGSKTIMLFNGEKISNWKSAIAEYSNKIYLFSEKNHKYMVLYKKKIRQKTFAFMIQPN